MPSPPQAGTTYAGVVRKKLAPGAPGTRRLQQRYGMALVCVRYREVETADGKQHRLTTVELVVDDREVADAQAWLRIGYDEARLRQIVKHAGGVWDSQRRLWRIRAGAVKKLGLGGRVVTPDA